MNADLHNLDDQPTEPWEPESSDSLYEELTDPELLALEMADAELEQIDHWIDVAEQNDQSS